MRSSYGLEPVSVHAQMIKTMVAYLLAFVTAAMPLVAEVPLPAAKARSIDEDGVRYEPNAVRLQDVPTSVVRFHSYRLIEGYRGSLSPIAETPDQEQREPRVFEFSAVTKHVWLRSDSEFKIQLLEAFESPDDRVSMWSWADYREKLPSTEELRSWTAFEPFEKLIGRENALWGAMCWGGVKDPVSRTTFDGAVFEILPSGAVRVISVSLGLYQKAEEPWQIEKRHIREGVFLPTGKPPVFRKRTW